MPLMLPSDGSASWPKAWGEKLRSPILHASQLSVSWTWMVLSWSGVNHKDQWDSRRKRESSIQVTSAVLLQIGFLVGPPKVLCGTG